MKKKKINYIIVMVFSFALLLSCSGKLTVKGTVKESSDTSQPTAAVLTLASNLNGPLPDGTIIGGYDVTVTLPDGVTVKSASPPQTDEGVVTTTGAGTGASLAATYTPGSVSSPGKVRIMIAKTDGMSAGEFVKINCDISAGHDLAASDFPPPTFTASGFDTKSNTTVDLSGKLTISESVWMNGGTATRPCTYNYTDWSPCENGTQSRLWVSSSPAGCEGTPVLSQTCEKNTTHTLISIDVQPDFPGFAIAAGTSSQLFAFGRYYDATSADITNSVIWSSNNTSIATVNAFGVVTVNSSATPGTSFTITATQGSVAGSRAVLVAEEGKY